MSRFINCTFLCANSLIKTNIRWDSKLKILQNKINLYYSVLKQAFLNSDFIDYYYLETVIFKTTNLKATTLGTFSSNC